jgi:carbamoyltransferase
MNLENTMSVVLGFSCTSHDSSATLFIDGKLVAAIAEERLTRIKCTGKDIPRLAIDEVLRHGGVTRADVTHIGALSGYFPEEYFHWISPRREFHRKLKRLSRRLRGKPTEIIWTGHNDREARAAGVTLESRMRKELFLEREGFRPGTTVSFHSHHGVHALLAGFYSGFDECLVVTADGFGDLDEAHTSGIYRNGKLEHICGTNGIGYSAGMFYMTITELLGFRPLRHEGKVLGLAAFGDPAPLHAAFSKALRLSDDRMSFLSDFNHPDTAHEDRVAFLREVIVGHSRENVAAAAQQVLEESYIGHVQELIKRTGVRRIAMNGGVAANVKLNQRVAQIPEVEAIFVFPGMSDSGNSVGAALFAQEQDAPGFLAAHQHALRDVYLGPEYADADIERELEAHQLRYEKLDQAALVDRAARAMHEGLVVGWFQGRMEFGPRALGNRSMVGHPTDAAINKSLNDRLERTEFMPFAPSVLAERADEIFIGVDKAAHPAEFMTVTFDVREEWKSRIPAVVHVDGTARPQLVRADRNPLYHALIKRYGELSGIPLVLNTSFNVHEEPIVCAPAEGIRALREDRIDALAVGPFWVDNPLRQSIR